MICLVFCFPDTCFAARNRFIDYLFDPTRDPGIERWIRGTHTPQLPIRTRKVIKKNKKCTGKPKISKKIHYLFKILLKL